MYDKQAGRIEIRSPDALIQDLPLEPGEAFSVEVHFELLKNYRPTEGILPTLDLIQTGAPGDPRAIVGGQEFEVDLSKLVLIKVGDKWRYLDDGSYQGAKWLSPNFDDSKWKLGQAELGFGGHAVTTIDGGPPDRRHITTYFRHTFTVADPSLVRSLLLRLKRDDGAVVYLNGKEIHRANLPSGVITPKTQAIRDVQGLEREMFFPTSVDLKLLRPGQNVVAVEIHQSSPRSDDLSFDLELDANRASNRFPPDISFASPMNGALWQKGEVIPVKVEALDSDGKIASVSLFADGRFVSTSDRSPYTFEWRDAPLGSHRLRAVALDNDQQKATADITVTVVENLPPAVRLTQPREGVVFRAGEIISAVAPASDRAGKVDRVEFFVRDADFFGASNQLVGTAKAAPYAVSIKGLPPGHYMLTALAWNDRGASSQSIPVHFEVSGQHRTR